MEPLLFSNKIYYDDRGFFTETYLKKKNLKSLNLYKIIFHIQLKA